MIVRWRISRVTVRAEAVRQHFVGIRLPLGVFERSGGGVSGLCDACGDNKVSRDGLWSYIVQRKKKDER